MLLKQTTGNNGLVTIKTQGEGKQLFAASCAEESHEQCSHAPLFLPNRVRSKAKNTLNWVQPSKIIMIN